MKQGLGRLLRRVRDEGGEEREIEIEIEIERREKLAMR